ncbi:hypothetical protein, partial [Nocardia abscessus]|uniref:hypothetical protein n=1 Tax=Nocardia abscessus TaxID=120957 RepID=UPI0024563B1B
MSTHRIPWNSNSRYRPCDRRKATADNGRASYPRIGPATSFERSETEHCPFAAGGGGGGGGGGAGRGGAARGGAARRGGGGAPGGQPAAP